MALNNAYAERYPVSEAGKAQLDRFIGPVTTALQPLADGIVPITADAVVDALASVDIRPVQTKGERDFIGFAYGTGEGCVFGEVKIDLLTVETGGIIADGGCMTAPGH